MVSKRTIACLGFIAALALVASGCEDDGIVAPAGSTVVVAASPSNLILDPDATVNTATSTITATVFDAAGIPRKDVLVSFSANGGTLTSGGSPKTTDDNGLATDTLTVAVNDPDSIEVTAASGTVTSTVTVLKTVAQGAIFLDASPANVIIDPDTGPSFGESTIEATVVDSDSNPIVGVQVNFSASGGTLRPPPFPLSDMTDDNGIATNILRLDLADPVSVTVTASYSGLQGSVEVMKTVIAGNQFPTAVLVANPVGQQRLDDPIFFIGTDSFDPDGVITCYEFEIRAIPPMMSDPVTEFVRGTSMTSVQRQYDTEQTVAVTLRVSDDPAAGALCQSDPAPGPPDSSFSPNSDQLIYSIVCDPTDPLADAGPNQTTSLAAGGSVTLDGSGSIDPDSPTLTYRWTCPGATSPGPFPDQATTCTYSSLGTFSATLRVTNECGGFDEDVAVVTVLP